MLSRIGIIGGGQLGRMMILAGAPLGFEFGVLTPRADDPAASLARHLVLGEIHDPGAIAALAGWADVTTYEIEHINTDALLRCEAAGHLVRPSPQALATINDKLLQKQTLSDAGVPTPAFRDAPPSGYPMVQKLRYGGYDGRGVKVLTSPADPPLEGVSYFEELVDIGQELAVLVARTPSGTTSVYPVAAMEFDLRANICSRVTMPADLEPSIRETAIAVSTRAVEAIGIVGITAVELFLTADGEILVNELAPRPHNSGHLTIDACETSQFEQHLRAICDLPLGSVELRSPSVMVNILGAPEASGAPRFLSLPSLLAEPGVHVHWYGKRQVRPFRKMGHLTVCRPTLGEASSVASRVESMALVGGE